MGGRVSEFHFTKAKVVRSYVEGEHRWTEFDDGTRSRFLTRVECIELGCTEEEADEYLRAGRHGYVEDIALARKVAP